MMNKIGISINSNIYTLSKTHKNEMETVSYLLSKSLILSLHEKDLEFNLKRMEEIFKGMSYNLIKKNEINEYEQGSSSGKLNGIFIISERFIAFFKINGEYILDLKNIVDINELFKKLNSNDRYEKIEDLYLSDKIQNKIQNYLKQMTDDLK